MILRRGTCKDGDVAVRVTVSVSFVPAGAVLGPAGAAVAAGRLLRYVAASGESLDQLVDSLPQYHATPETRLACPEDRKFEVPELLKAEFAGKHRVIDIDGIRVEFGDGWGLVRASNTQPVLVVRFEARTEKRLAEIRELMMSALRRLGVGETPVSH